MNVDNENMLTIETYCVIMLTTVIIPRSRAGCNGRKACHKGYSKVERLLLPGEGGRATARVEPLVTARRGLKGDRRVPTTPLLPPPLHDGDSREGLSDFCETLSVPLKVRSYAPPLACFDGRWCFLFNKV